MDRGGDYQSECRGRSREEAVAFLKLARCEAIAPERLGWAFGVMNDSEGGFQSLTLLMGEKSFRCHEPSIALWPSL